MKSKFLKKIIAVAVVGTSISSFASTNAFAVSSSDFYNWQNMNNGQSNFGWRQYNGKWYYFNYVGMMQTGWVYDYGKWYYIDSTGVMQTGVIQVNGKIYLFSESGSMQTGNAVINGTYYTFGEYGSAVGENIPVPIKAFDLSGVTAIPYTPNQIIKDEDSSPSTPNTEARDPNNLVKYNVKFKDEDGDEFSTKTIEKNEKITLYKPTKNGYKFVEWTTKKNGNGKSYDAGDAITIKDDLTLYAQWEDSSTSDTKPTDKVLVEDITVTSTTGLNTITTKAGTLQMSAKVLPINATNNAVTWSVIDNTGKATISLSGLLTATANGTVSVVATANDTSKVVGRTNITISGQADAVNPDDGGKPNTGGDTSTQTGGTITTFAKTVNLYDVVIDTPGNIVDLPLLKASGKLPTKAKVTCSLSDGTVKEIEVGIKEWTGNYNGAVGSYYLIATLGDLPSGYTKADTLNLPSGTTLKVIVTGLQTDSRKAITGAASIAEITLDSDKHIMNTELLNASGILPKTVTLNYDGGTVVANVKSWKCISTNAIDGGVGPRDLVAEIENPVGYVVPSNIVNVALKVTVAQTANIQEIVGVIKNADIPDPKNKLLLDYATGDVLNLSGLKVNVKYNDGKLGTISYADFANNNITTPGYYDKMPLYTTNSTTIGIPVMFNGKKVYTGELKVVQASNPSITADGSATYSTTTPSAVTFNYTLGTGSKKTTKIESVTLGTTELTSVNDYTINDVDKKLIISKSKLEEFINGKTTPVTYMLKVTFTEGTNKLTSSTNIGFISTPAPPSGISLATDTLNSKVVPAKDNTIKLLGLADKVIYEYCVVDSTSTTPNWSNAKYFDTIDTTKELTDISFVAGKNLYIRIKSTSAGSGALNPPSDPLILILSSTNIGKTLNSEKSIKSFSLKDVNGSYVGIITEGTTANSGTIRVVVPTVGHDITPTEMLVSNLTVNFTLSDKAKLTAGGIVQTSGTTIDFTNPVTYTVTAENGTTKDYTVTVVKTKLQASSVRPDTLTKTKKESTGKTDTNGNLIYEDKTEECAFWKEYTNGAADISIDYKTNNGLVNITLPDTFITSSTRSTALNKIRDWTPYMKDKDPLTAYVGLVLTKSYDTAVSIKSAGSLDGLKNATIIKLSSVAESENVSKEQYLEQIPVATVGAGGWSKIKGSNTTKYYAWIDGSGNVLGYTSLTIKVV